MTADEQSHWHAIPDRESCKRANQASENCPPDGPQQSCGARMPQCAQKVIPISQGLWQAEYRVKDYSQALRFDGLPRWVWTCLGPATPFFPISPFRTGRVYPIACPAIVFWKHITCFISWVHSWRAIYLRMNRTLSLMHI